MRLTATLLLFALCVANVGRAQDPAYDKLPVPTQDAQKEAGALIRDVYKAEYKQARTPTQKRELAQKFVGKAIQTDDDAAGRYVLLTVARDMATSSGDIKTAITAVDSIFKFYDTDGVKAKRDVLGKVSKGRVGRTLGQEIAISALETIDEATSSDRYELASDLANIALKAARKSSRSELTKQVVAVQKQVSDVRAAYRAASEAEEVLAKAPGDAKANLTVGVFRCFYKGEWATGLPMLALCENETLRELATIDLGKPSTANAQIKLGDGWWRVAEEKQGIAKNQIQLRSAKWYREPLPTLNGLVKDRIAGRLEQVKVASNEPIVKQLEPTANRKAAVKQGPTLNGSQTVEKRVLRQADNPHELVGIYRLSKGQKLVIEAGVEIVCGAGSEFLIVGDLNVDGTKAKPVVFRGYRTVPGYWKGISAESGAGVLVQHATVKDAKTAIQLSSTEAKLIDCIIIGNEGGIRVNPGHLSITNSVVAWNTGHGISTDNSGRTSIDHCSIAQNGKWGLHAVYRPNFKIQNSVITRNREGGILGYLYDSKAFVSESAIGGNGNVQVQNRATGDWDFRNNYWDEPVAAWIKNPVGDENTRPIRGSVRADNPLDKVPEKCGASVRKIGKRVVW